MPTVPLNRQVLSHQLCDRLEAIQKELKASSIVAVVEFEHPDDATRGATLCIPAMLAKPSTKASYIADMIAMLLAVHINETRKAYENEHPPGKRVGNDSLMFAILTPFIQEVGKQIENSRHMKNALDPNP